MYTEFNYSYAIRSDFNETTNLKIKNQLKENLQNHKFFISSIHDIITSDLLFIKKFVSQMNVLHVDARNGFNSKDMEEIKYTLSNLNIKVSFVV